MPYILYRPTPDTRLQPPARSRDLEGVGRVAAPPQQPCIVLDAKKVSRAFARTHYLLAVSMFLACVVLAQNPSSPEQKRFSAEDETVTRPIALPDAILSQLANDQDNATLLQTMEPVNGKLPRSWFLASEVRLRDPQERDVIVIGRDPILGANVTTFWLFRPRGGQFDLLLKATAHTLQIRDSHSNGYRDIDTASATARTVTTRQFRFDGSVYKSSSPRSEQIR